MNEPEATPEFLLLDAIAEANSREKDVRGKIDWLIKLLVLLKREITEGLLRNYLLLLGYNIDSSDIDPQHQRDISYFLTNAAAIEIIKVTDLYNDSLIKFGSQEWIDAKTSKELLAWKYQVLDDAEKMRTVIDI